MVTDGPEVASGAHRSPVGTARERGSWALLPAATSPGLLCSEELLLQRLVPRGLQQRLQE